MEDSRLTLHARRGEELRVWQLNPGRYKLGSDPAIPLCLSYPTISREHAEIFYDGKEVRVSDLGSKNGTRLQRRFSWEKVASEAVWQANTLLEVGPFELKWFWSPLNDVKLDFHLRCKQMLETYYREQDQITHSGNRLDRLRQRCLENSSTDGAAIFQRLDEELSRDAGLGVYLASPSCREILGNRHDQVFVDVGRGLELAEYAFLTQRSYEAWVIRTANAAGRRLDLQHPVCEATLTDGARFHAVLPPIAHPEVQVTIRRFHSSPKTVDELLNSGFITRDGMNKLQALIHEKKNIVISGGTSTGKTTLLNFLCSFISENERVITVEDTIELQPLNHHCIQLQGRRANADGAGTIGLRQLVQSALRMRPDRILVGECRGAEILEMLQAMNTGHPGSMTTLHANSAKEALARIELLALLESTNLSREALREWISSTIDIVIQLKRDESGKRYVESIKTADLVEIYAHQMA